MKTLIHVQTSNKLVTSWQQIEDNFKVSELPKVDGIEYAVVDNVPIVEVPKDKLRMLYFIDNEFQNEFVDYVKSEHEIMQEFMAEVVRGGVQADKLSSADVKFKMLDVDGTPIENLKLAKIEQLKELCTQSIHNGFTSIGFTFGFNDKDQLNFNSQTNKINIWLNRLSMSDMTQEEFNKKFPLPWKSKSHSVVYLTLNQFLQVIDDGEKHMMAQQGKYWALEQKVIYAKTKEQVLALNW